MVLVHWLTTELPQRLDAFPSTPYDGGEIYERFCIQSEARIKRKRAAHSQSGGGNPCRAMQGGVWLSTDFTGVLFGIFGLFDLGWPASLARVWGEKGVRLAEDDGCGGCQVPI